MRTQHLSHLLIAGTALGLPALAQDALPPMPTQSETTDSVPVQTSPGGAQVSFARPVQAEQPTAPAPAPAAQQGNCKLMASNTVRVIYRGVAESGWGAAPAAHFVVIENLAHKSYAPEGDGALAPGTLIGVELRRDIPGQPAGVVDAIMAMRPGEEALMRMDHLYMLDQATYGDLRVCGRFQARAAAAAGQAATGAIPYGLNRPGASAPSHPAAPAYPTATAVPQNTTRTTTGASGEVSTKWEVDSQGHVRERIYVNGEEVPPPSLETTSPVPTHPESASGSTLAPSPAVPDRVIPEDASGDDTVVETPAQPTAPVTPAPQAATPATATFGSSTASPSAPAADAPVSTPTSVNPDYDPTQDSF